MIVVKLKDKRNRRRTERFNVEPTAHNRLVAMAEASRRNPGFMPLYPKPRKGGTYRSKRNELNLTR